jgi:hypothetical protein
MEAYNQESWILKPTGLLCTKSPFLARMAITRTADSEKDKEDIVQSVPSVHVDEPPYFALPEQIKIVVILTASFASIISPFSTGVYYPAVTVTAQDLGVSITLINLTISTYQVRNKASRTHR